MSAGAPLLGGFALDLIAADPERWHPVAGFGALAAAAERTSYAPSRARGAAVTTALVTGAALTGELLARGVRRDVAMVALTWAALGGASLRREAARVSELAAKDDLPAARGALRALCGRDAAELDEAGLARAIVESLAENTSDAVIGGLLWGALAGPAGIAGYRAANTLDAMFGHRDERYRQFGWAAARLDDVVNWPVARLSAALTAVLAPLVGGSPRATVTAIRRDSSAHPSPNAGVAEAAFAGALGLRLGGPLTYAGVVEHRPLLGDGRAPSLSDVPRAARLSLAVGLAGAALCAALREGLR
ncbi:MAG TPA: cobalamin biosynthesis protein [Solirubrobacteraceae bacterium]|nr:cobalamin biosynthesis protein [Solirubrobacteraceae bacterium]